MRGSTPGCKYIDQIELMAIDLAKKLFGAEFADVRPVSGACANLAVYSAIADPNDVMMALSIPNGGHISAGKKEFSGHGRSGSWSRHRVFRLRQGEHEHKRG